MLCYRRPLEQVLLNFMQFKENVSFSQHNMYSSGARLGLDEYMLCWLPETFLVFNNATAKCHLKEIMQFVITT
jgi:hypothetical protein